MSPPAEEVIRRLDAARQQWWLFTLLTTAVLATCTSFGLLLAFTLADAAARLSQTALSLLSATWLAATLGLIIFVFRRLTRSQRSLEATARRVEAEIPELGSDLINVVQLSTDTCNADHSFCEAAVNSAAARLDHVRFDEAARRETRWRRFLYCMQTPRDFGESLVLLVLLIAAAMLSQMLLPNLGSAANRLMKPWDYVPSVGAVGEIRVVPGDAEILVGTSLEITAEIANAASQACKATLFTRPADEKESTVAMSADDKGRTFKAVLPSVVKAFQYRVEIADSQSKVYSIRVREKPIVSEVEVTLRFPSYLGRASETFVQKTADLEAPVYTEAELRVRPSVRIERGFVKCEGQQIDGRVEGDGLLLVVRMPLLKSGAFTIHLLNDAGHSDPDPRVNRIHVLPDNPPTVELLKPGRMETAAPGADLAVTIRAGDDHGVGRVRLEMKVRDAETAKPDPKSAVGGYPRPRQRERVAAKRPGEGGQDWQTATRFHAPSPPAPLPQAGEGRLSGQSLEATEADSEPPTTVQEWTRFEGSTTVVLQRRMTLGADLVKPGQTLMLRAKAWDKRYIDDFGLTLNPQETASPWHLVKVVAPEVKSTAALEQLESLRAAILKIFEAQVRARMKAGTLIRTKEPAGCANLAAEVRTQQVQIQKESALLVKTIGDSAKDERKAIQRIIQGLASGDMLAAVQQCDELVKVKALDGFAKSTPALLTVQDRILAVLRKLLDVSRQAQTEALAELKKKPGSDLPDEQKKRLEELKNKLEKLLEQQKKVIEASESLAKKPVEDFTKEDEQLLKNMAQVQDDFSKFMKELNTDLSKLPEQDFANSSMAKELNEVQTELKMAEDALLKKSADIAVPLEQLGYERAEEIKTNIEKWLPDTPDREKWSQEESLSDQDKEAPMAELPGELEDLIGDLMEEEEDLFDEMEDVSSSAIDSADKGIGWDAMDGPISNNSAKGVTGNRLPNSSEIGGRSGEGRQGKSSGEFVGDEAVGKGGRKTPTRLTPDPFVKGQIKDHSKENTGGGTGGGKESGQGGEGLEGPRAGPEGRREMQRLAGKQAALRNKAESVDMQFQVSKYHRTDLKKLIDVMGQVERDLKVGRYQNALRQRQVLAEAAGNVKQYLQGEIQTKQDTTANIPTDVQKDILGGMQDPSPAGWEEINRRYFQGLATGGNEPPSGSGGAAGKETKK